MPGPHEGGCQCGAVRYRITGEAGSLYACHCTSCQTQSGSAFGLSMRLPADRFELTRGRLKSCDRQGREKVITGWFCADCGTRIRHTIENLPDVVSLVPGTLDDTSWLPAPIHVWGRSAQAWFEFPDDATVFETGSADAIPLKR